MKTSSNNFPYNSVVKRSKLFSACNNTDNQNTPKNPVDVYCRLRPLSNSTDIPCINLESSEKIIVTPIEDPKNRNKCYQYTFKFKHIFTEDNNQQEIFENVALPLLNGFLQGENGLLFTYGVTCSGKTYTMFGEYDNPGIVPRCIFTLFNTIGENHTPKYLIKSDKLNGFEMQTEYEAMENRIAETKINRYNIMKKSLNKEINFINDGTTLNCDNTDLVYTVFISFVEIYNNIVYDLLDESSGSKMLQSKILREDHNKNIYVNNVVELEIKTAKDAIDLYCMGNKRKRMAETNLNDSSSRSHSIFTIRLVIANVNFPNDFIVSQLSLVDLAGSERCHRTNSSGQRLKEASSINNSLMALRTCIENLRDNQENGANKIIPYRDSRLTHMFKTYFEGHGKVKMIICVNPSIKEFEENLHVMKFAEMTQEVKILKTKSSILGHQDIYRQFENKLEEKEHPELNNYHSCKIIPKVRIQNPEDTSINSLILFLKKRKQAKARFNLIQKQTENFRQHLVELQKDKDNYEKQANYLLPAERERVKNFKEKIHDMKIEYDQIVEKCNEKENIISELQAEIGDKDMKINQNLLDKQKLKRKLTELSDTLTHQLDTKLRHQRDYLKAQIKTQVDKIEMVKDILSSNYVPSVSSDNINKNESIKTATSHKKFPSVEQTSEMLLPSKLSEETNDQNIQNNYIETNLNETELTEKNSNVPHPVRGKAISNPRYNRCSTSDGVWLEHKPAMPVPLGTVFQPKMKNKKSVTKLTNKNDIVKSKRNKYVLIAQDKDNEGSLETKLYKGDIIPTCSGGAQVILNDVEKLKQESPTKESE